MPFAPLSVTLSLLVAFQVPGGKGDWRKVTSEAGRFSVMMPGKAEEGATTQATDDGPVEVHNIAAESDGIRYLATEMVNPTKMASDQQAVFFDGLRQSYGAGDGKSIQKEQRGTFKGMPICYFRIGLKDAQGRPKVEQARFLLADPTHVYVLRVNIPKGVDVNDDVKRFFDSFQWIEAVAGPASKGVAKATASEKGKAPGQAAAAKWRSFTPAGKGFTTSMPGEPKFTKQDPTDGSMKIDFYEVHLGDRAYSVACIEVPNEFPAENRVTAMENMGRDLANGMKGAVAELKAIQVEGLEGREIRYDFANPDDGRPAVGRCRTFVVGARAYLMSYTGAKGTADREEVQKFLESFRTTKPGSPAKGKAKARP